jgi:seryl-tRNA synthetase
MLDLRFIRDNLDNVKKNIENRFMQADPEGVIALFEKRNGLIAQAEELRQKRNENAKSMKAKLSNEERSALIEEGKILKTQISDLEKELSICEHELNEEHKRIPNMAHPDAPIGKEDKDNSQIKQVGDIPQFDFKAKDHVELGEQLDILDFEKGTKVSGTKFYFLKREGAILELALTRYTTDILQKHGFILTITPDLAKEEIVEGVGFQPRGEESNIYTVEDTGLCLVGTAEITLGGYHSKEMLNKADLPLKYAGISHCFRREAGAAGQYSKGLYRVHQFTKVEMFVYCSSEDSEKIHDQLLAIEEEIFQGLEIPYRVVDTCTGDLGAPAYRKFDIEAWMPGRGETGDWGEVTSTSNCTDYQSRRLSVRAKDENGKEYVHMLNGTAMAMSRGIVAVLENGQQKDGSIRIPKALQPYTGFDKISR